ncbi:MAG: putative toxin-antitoxin system toxin component, PIN family [Zoogloeaceae bacterium]|jgi:putative PIN family toxin of toxin-antitoxin system|nr:putative toxin-antitoxin system toxin component, PIN family [Zoogloeaceae bacterium]
MTQRLVLDTRIVLSALLFTTGRLAWIRHAWQQDRLQPLVCRETAHDLLCALSYPKFKLSAAARQDLLHDFLPSAEVVALPTPWPDLPACRDARDQMFLALAYAGKADALVTESAALLAMREVFSGIWMADELKAQMAGP